MAFVRVKKVKTILLAALVLLSMVCMFFMKPSLPAGNIRGTAWWSIFLRERFCLSFACWDIFCTCFFVPAFLFTGRCGRASVFVLGGMSLAFEYVNVFFPVALLAGYLFRFTIFRKFRNHLPWSGNVTGFLPWGSFREYV